MKNKLQDQSGIGHLLAIFGVLVVLAIVVAGFGVYRSNKPSEQKSATTSTPSTSEVSTQEDYLKYAPKNIKPTTEQTCAGKPYSSIYLSTTENLAFDIPPGEITLDAHCLADTATNSADSFTVESTKANFFVFRQDPLLKETKGDIETRTVYSVENINVAGFGTLKLVKVGFKQKNGQVYYQEALTDLPLTVGKQDLPGGGPQLTFDGKNKTQDGLTHVMQMVAYTANNHKSTVDYHAAFFDSSDVKVYENSMRSLRAQ